MEKKYSTIDPLIFETLHNNEDLMNHLQQLLEGRDKYAPRTERKSTKLPKIFNDHHQFRNVCSDPPSYRKRLPTLNPEELTGKSGAKQSIVVSPRKDRSLNVHGERESMKRGNKLEVNSKDIYRMQIEALVSEPLRIKELEHSEKAMRKLKRRYQHLRKFDGRYYSNLNRKDLLAV